ncbi:MAG: redox-regulated ATPase YchF [Limnochordia bacterium]|jgi:GTP-binding protein YchF
MFSYGIIGLPNAGKSTLFNALTRGAAAVAAYPFCTIEPNLGEVAIPDPQLEAIAKVTEPEKVTPAMMRFVDIAGLVRGASKGEGMGNQFLTHIRDVDALIHVLRCFPIDDVSHPEGSLDPLRDAGIVETELILADISVLERRRERLARLLKTGDPKYKIELQTTDELIEHLYDEHPARTFAKGGDLSDLLTGKPVVYAANIAEEYAANPEEDATFRLVKQYAQEQGAQSVPVCAALEAELAELPWEEQRAFLKELGLARSALERLVEAGYQESDLITFYTVKGPETRAWAIPRGTLAPAAAGRIHTDMEKGFIRAEVINWANLIEIGSFAAARGKGTLRLEGRDYQIQDGDVVLFRFKT